MRTHVHPRALSLSLSVFSSPGHEGCLTPPGHVAPPLFMGALEESESLLDVSTLTIMEKHVSSSLSLSLCPCDLSCRLFRSSLLCMGGVGEGLRNEE